MLKSQKRIKQVIKRQIKLSQDCQLKKAICPKGFAIIHTESFSEELTKVLWKLEQSGS